MIYTRRNESAGTNNNKPWYVFCFCFDVAMLSTLSPFSPGRTQNVVARSRFLQRARMMSATNVRRWLRYQGRSDTDAGGVVGIGRDRCSGGCVGAARRREIGA